MLRAAPSLYLSATTPGWLWLSGVGVDVIGDHQLDVVLVRTKLILLQKHMDKSALTRQITVSDFVDFERLRLHSGKAIRA